jgi:hypothetical protein
MVTRESVCLRRMADGQRAQIVRFGRFLNHAGVTVDGLLASWGEQTAVAAVGRHVLAIQDTTDIKFPTTAARRRGLGEVGKGNRHGVVAHVMMAVDAATGACLGLVDGEVMTRGGRVTTPHSKRPLADKESRRWLDTAQSAKTVLRGATMVTVVADRESDIYAQWARLPEPNFHLLTRAMHDRALDGGGKLSTAALVPGGTARIELRERPGRAARCATLTIRFGPVMLARPSNTLEPGLPKSVPVSVVEVIEQDPPAGVEPVHWRLLTTHAVPDAAAAWQIVAWYRMRWTIEQLFRTLKRQGLQIEDSQIETAERLIKLVAIAVKAACIVMQLVHARDGTSDQPAAIAFTPPEIATLDALGPTLEGATKLQQNPHPRHSLAWAAWIIAKLGGWDGYPSSKPPGPITFKHGLERFFAIARGWALRNV